MGLPVMTLPLTVVIGTFGEMDVMTLPFGAVVVAEMDVVALPFGAVVVAEMDVVALPFGAMLVVLVMEEMVRVLVRMDVLVRLGEMVVELDALVGSGEMVVGEMVVEFLRLDVSFLRTVSVRSGKAATMGRHTKRNLEHLQQQQLKRRGEGRRASFW